MVRGLFENAAVVVAALYLIIGLDLALAHSADRYCPQKQEDDLCVLHPILKPVHRSSALQLATLLPLPG